MRKRLLLTFICALSVVMAMAQRTNPDVADYFIKGYLSIERGSDGKPIYKLSDIQKRGISFDDPGSVVRGFETDKEDVRFQFSHYTTSYLNGEGVNVPLDFWRYDEAINEWQPDVETRQGSAGVQEKKSMVLMLVLDCSSSLSSDFSFVQEASKEFIKSLLDASNAGNIKIGIVGFSRISATEFFPITRLTNDSYYDMCRFINARNVQNGTALYYAMDKAIDAIESYCNTSIPYDEPLSSAMIVTFTDGLDQTSRDENKGIYTADDYYIELQRKMNNKRFNGVPLQSKMRGVRGVDIATDAQLGKFSQIGNSLGEFKLLDNISALGKEFNDIAKSLINEWRVLNCFVPNSFKGKVAWTYPSRKSVVEKPEPPKEPKQKGRFLIGINAGIGSSYSSGSYNYFGINYNAYSSLSFSGGVDLAFPIGKAANLGVFTSLGYEIEDESILISAGPLFLININEGKAGAVYLGAGYMNAQENDGINLRIGYKSKRVFYLFNEVFAVDGYNGLGTGYGDLIHVGFFF